MRLVPDRERCADLGVPVAQVSMLLRSAVEGDRTMKFREGRSIEDIADVPVGLPLGRGMLHAPERFSPRRLSGWATSAGSSLEGGPPQ